MAKTDSKLQIIPPTPLAETVPTCLEDEDDDNDDDDAAPAADDCLECHDGDGDDDCLDCQNCKSPTLTTHWLLRSH